MNHSEQKRLFIFEALQRAEVHLVVDARQPGVAVPSALAQDQLQLKFSYRYGYPIEVTDWGIAATLTFGGQPFQVRVPWTAIYAGWCPALGQQWAWPKPDAPVPTTPAKRGGLRLVN